MSTFVLNRTYASDEAFLLALLLAIGVLAILFSFRLGVGDSYAI